MGCELRRRAASARTMCSMRARSTALPLALAVAMAALAGEGDAQGKSRASAGAVARGLPAGVSAILLSRDLVPSVFVGRVALAARGPEAPAAHARALLARLQPETSELALTVTDDAE